MYPGGAGGNWLANVLAGNKDNFAHPHWHHIHSVAHIEARHNVGAWKNYYTLNGAGYFNFFLNHVYKLFHLINNIYASDFENYWMQTVGIGKWVCEYAKFSQPKFDFDSLVNQPEDFYLAIRSVQQLHQITPTDKDSFYTSRDYFLQSCVNPDGIFGNLDNLYYVAFILGQLSMDEIYPSFSIADIKNIDNCKQFVSDNQSRCRYTNYYKIGNVTELPSLV